MKTKKLISSALTFFLLTGGTLFATTNKIYKIDSSGYMSLEKEVSEDIKGAAVSSNKFYLSSDHLIYETENTSALRQLHRFDDNVYNFWLSEEKGKAIVATGKQIMWFDISKDGEYWTKTATLDRSGVKLPRGIFPADEGIKAILITKNSLECYDRNDLVWEDPNYYEETIPGAGKRYKKIVAATLNKSKNKLFVLVEKNSNPKHILYCYNVYTGNIEWEHKFFDTVGAEAIISHNSDMAIATSDQIIIANVANGYERKNSHTFTDGVRGFQYNRNKNEMTVITGEELINYTLDSDFNFERNWSHRFEDEPLLVADSMDSSRHYVITDDDEIMCFDSNGNKIFTNTYNGDKILSIIGTDDGGLLFATTNANGYSFIIANCIGIGIDTAIIGSMSIAILMNPNYWLIYFYFYLSSATGIL